MYCCGIDVGGTKIETVLFNRNLEVVAHQRIDTPKNNYSSFLQAIVDEIKWARNKADSQNIPVGISFPGVISSSGRAYASNTPVDGELIHKEIKAIVGGEVYLDNDCNCFTLSELEEGIARDYKSAFGLVISTGVGGGFCFGDQMYRGATNSCREVGHLSLPHNIFNYYDLKLEPLECGCGEFGCYETFLSGKGLSALAKVTTGSETSAEHIISSIESGDERFDLAFNIWKLTASYLIREIHCMLNPECIVLGGGLDPIPSQLTQ